MSLCQQTCEAGLRNFQPGPRQRFLEAILTVRFRCIAGILPGSHDNLYGHTLDTRIGAISGPGSAQVRKAGIHDRQGIGGNIRTGLSQFDIPPGTTGIAHFGSVAGSVSGSADW